MTPTTVLLGCAGEALVRFVSLLNHHVGANLDLKDVDLDCLDLIANHGPLSPSTLARRAGLHPATVSGIIDRLERGDWVARERDRRASRQLSFRRSESRIWAALANSAPRVRAGPQRQRSRLRENKTPDQVKRGLGSSSAVSDGLRL
jgi:DNA-binding MarR family transcriptional regulator